MVISQPFGTILLPLVGGVLCLILGRKTRIPSILFLLIFGIGFGPEFANIIQPSAIESILNPTISLLIALVLFEGGASLKVDQFREISSVLRSLLTVGVLTTLITVALAAYFIGNLSLGKSFLFGSIMIVTGPTVIVPILRRVRVRSHLHNILKWEAILVDPLGVILSVVLFELLHLPQMKIWEGLQAFGFRILIGVLLGLIAGWIMKMGLTKKWLLRFESEELGGLFILGMNLFFYGLSEILLPHSGLVVATVAGIYLGNQSFSSKDQVFHFATQITLFALSILFILISSHIPVSSLHKYLEQGLLILAVMIFVSRPLTVFSSTRKEKGMPLSEKLFLSSLAPRGIVSASLATLFALSFSESGILSAEQFLPLSFIVISGTIIFYSLFSLLMTRLPGVQEPPQKGILLVGANPFAIFLAKEIQKEDIPVTFIDTNPHFCQKARKNNFEAYQGSAVNADFIESLDLKGIGKMVALTSNHELNVLSCQTISRFIGKENVFRLWDKMDAWDRVISHEFDSVWGRPLVVSLSDDFWQLWQLTSQGINPITAEKGFGNIFRNLKFDKNWRIHSLKLTEPIKMTPENLNQKGIDFPLYAKNEKDFTFIYPELSLAKGMEIVFISRK
ncbi:hypothetical protein BVX98_01695 [bacterium F11]|nr:hypothetical protein BVX98_01695 [bacterium F11]